MKQKMISFLDFLIFICIGILGIMAIALGIFAVYFIISNYSSIENSYFAVDLIMVTIILSIVMAIVLLITLFLTCFIEPSKTEEKYSK